MSTIFQTISLLDDLLIRIGEKLQLNKSRREMAETSYKAVAKWLSEDDTFFNKYRLSIYPQGSYKLGTTVKPRTREEYDLDFVLEVDIHPTCISPIELLNQVERRLKENMAYKGKVEKKKRCICINYERDFHLDIIPATPKTIFDGKDIKICDRKLQEWLDSSPKGYIEWFESKYLVEHLLLERAASIQELPAEIPYSTVQPLQKVVQLMKRYRDIYFENEDEEHAPRSIVLTTLAGHFYNNYRSENEALLNILNEINKAVTSSPTPIEIPNPANNNEKFSDLWNNKPHLYKHFQMFINDFNTQWKLLNEAQGVNHIQRNLQNMFGEDISKQVISEQTDYIDGLRKTGKLGVTRLGTIAINTSPKINPIKKNTFYGKIQ